MSFATAIKVPIALREATWILSWCAGRRGSAVLQPAIARLAGLKACTTSRATSVVEVVQGFSPAVSRWQA